MNIGKGFFRKLANDRLRFWKGLGRLIGPNPRHRFFRIDIAYHKKRHVAWVIEGIVAKIQVFCGDLRNAFHRTSDIDMQGVLRIQIFDDTEKLLPVRIVIIHLDFLTNDPFFFFDGFFCEIRGLNEIDQRFKVQLDLIGCRKKVAGFRETGKGIGRSPLLTKGLKDIAVFFFKQFVL